MKKITITFIACIAFANCAYTITSDQISELGLLNALNVQNNPELDPTLPSVTVSNLQTGLRVHSGFLIGTSAAPTSSGSLVTAVEVAYDGGSYSNATGTTNWSMQLPAGASLWKMNSSHTIQVRSLAANGNFSAVITLTVRKDINRDVNGDGYQDTVVGASVYNTNQGRAYIFPGGASGLSSKAAGLADTIFTGEANSGFGSAAGIGDINGDGYGDVIVGASTYNTNQGRTYIFHGGAAGIASKSAAAADATLTGTGANIFFGSSLDLGDANGDGYLDAIIGAPGITGDNGAVYIFNSGGAAGISTAGAAAADAVITHGGGVSLIGSAVDLGDVNGDGFADALVGHPHNGGTFSGEVSIFHSGGSGGIATATTAAANTTITGESNSRLGLSVVLADLNGDGFQDAVLGARTYNTATGRTYIFNGSASGITSAAATSANTIITGEMNSFSSQGLAAGDANGDGFVDLIVSANGSIGGAIPNSGRAYVFYSAGSSGIASTGAASAGTIFSGSTILTNAGDSVGLTDLNGDGFADVMMGGRNVNNGEAYYFQSAGAAGPASQDLGGGGTATATLTGETSSEFGGSMSR